MDIEQLVFQEKDIAVLEHRSIYISGNAQCLVKHDCTLVSPGTEVALFHGTHIGFGDPDISWARYPVYPGYAAVGSVIEAGSACALKAGEKVLYYGQHATHGILDTTAMLWAKLSGAPDLKPYLLARFAQIAYSAIAALHRPPVNVIVYGAGIVGNLCAQLMKTLPSVEKVIILDLAETRLAVAKNCGIEGAKSADDPPFTADTIVEATGSPTVINDALLHLGKRGQLVLLGSSRGTAEVNFYKYVHRKLASIIGAHETVLPQSSALEGVLQPFVQWRSQQEAVDGLVIMIKEGSLKTDAFIQPSIKPSEAETAYYNLLAKPNEYLGVFIDWR
jgi:2-desacetyl-2-hydroxyethyl bacteriochlorophyllide A dehydrogenase